VLPKSHLRFVLANGISVAEITQLLKVHSEYDQTPSGLLDRLKRILSFANIVADKIVCEETDLLEDIIPRMYEMMHRFAKVSYDYITHGRSSPDDFSKY